MGILHLGYLHSTIVHVNIVSAAQRQVGETALNNKSSRSHQIIRLVSSAEEVQVFIIMHAYFRLVNLPIYFLWLLYAEIRNKTYAYCSVITIFIRIFQTVESSLRESSGHVKSYIASLVCFVFIAWLDSLDNKLVIVMNHYYNLTEFCGSCWKWTHLSNKYMWSKNEGRQPHQPKFVDTCISHQEAKVQHL